MTAILDTAEGRRLEDTRQTGAAWRRWGPYLSDRQWGTVREDYSPSGTAWEYFPHDHARSRAYRWGEDGIAGVSDDRQRLCLALTLWNGEDDILKERLFGLTNSQGNHGEDVKECYFHLDNTPTHSYMKFLYKYPQRKFPYADLVAENARRKADPRSAEYELLDTGIFDGGRYFDVFVEYAKSSATDLLLRISAVNRGPDRRTLHLLPTLWFRNTWSWFPGKARPSLADCSVDDLGCKAVRADAGEDLGTSWLYCCSAAELLFTDNESNQERLGWGSNPPGGHFKDAFDRYVVHGEAEALNGARTGTKAAAYQRFDVEPGQTATMVLRLSGEELSTDPFADAPRVFAARQADADEFYAAVNPHPIPDDMRSVQRQAFAGLLWSKQFYNYSVKDWLNGDPAGPVPPAERKSGRNRDWMHVHSADIFSMPDTWEYPWFAAWDLAFHTISLALIDPEFAKQQLLLLTHEWHLHPNGQVPAYEWAFNDLNPPVQAWAAWRVYNIEQKMYGRSDRKFLEQIFQKLSLYFTWWMNREDRQGNDIFQGGFLGLDNIGVFNRSSIPASIGGYVDQADGSSWMAMYCLDMLRIALELGTQDSSYDAMAAKFFQNFLYIAEAINNLGGEGESLWDEADGFYYDVLHLTAGRTVAGSEYVPLEVRSVVGLIPLFAVEGIDKRVFELDELRQFRERFEWFWANRPEMLEHDSVAAMSTSSEFGEWVLLSVVTPERLRRILEKALDETEFLSPYGIRALSKYHQAHPFVLTSAGDGLTYAVEYAPGCSITGDFGGNSNWRGPVWFPINYLLVETLQKFHRYLGDSFTVESPPGSGRQVTLWQAAEELTQRLIAIFLQGPDGKRPVHGESRIFQEDPSWRDLILFYEYFHGDNGAGVGASHQTGWTGLVAKLIQQWSEYGAQDHAPALTDGVGI